MSIDSQNFTIQNGDDYTIVFRNFDQNGNKLMLSNYTFIWVINTPIPIYKTSGNINLNEIDIILSSMDTNGLKGSYNHVLTVYDFNNKKYTLSKGVVTFI
jgi:hypothetical protein